MYSHANGLMINNIDRFKSMRIFKWKFFIFLYFSLYTWHNRIKIKNFASYCWMLIALSCFHLFSMFYNVVNLLFEMKRNYVILCVMWMKLHENFIHFLRIFIFSRFSIDLKFISHIHCPSNGKLDFWQSSKHNNKIE